MASKLKYITLDVFTSTRFLGNPLAIVNLPFGTEHSQEEKQLIAREFNFSETVFIHENVSGDDDDAPVTIDIFTTTAELPFAGHPTVGTGWYLLSLSPEKQTITLRTKAGDIPVTRITGSSKVQLKVPTDYKEHPSYVHPTAKLQQPHLSPSDYVNGIEGAEPVVSIVKGMTFYLLQVSSEEALAKLQAFPQSLVIPNLGEWGGFAGLYAFFERSDGIVRTRMFDGTLEDPATGSAASTLAGWLGRRKGTGWWEVRIVQGVEMGRRSEIEVTVEVGDGGDVEGIWLGGEAVEVMEGALGFEYLSRSK